MHIVLATSNKGKIKEFKDLLQSKDPGLHVLGLNDFPDLGPLQEPGQTFYTNALAKAQAVCDHTGLIALADDSGLEVDALNGAPGVYSARYSGENATDEDNNAKLLQALNGVPPEERRARFKCVLIACTPGGEHITAQGTWEGRIAEHPRGRHGFGYDPVFVDLDSGRTAAEMEREEKSARSHRGRALRELIRLWPDFAAKTFIK